MVAHRRDAAGKLERRSFPADHCCFIRALDAAPDLRRTLSQASFVLGLRDEGDWVRVRWVSRDVGMRAIGADGGFAKRGVRTYEGDVDPVRRWITDSGVEPQRPRRCYLDIETDDRVPFSRKGDGRILCWAITDDAGARLTGVLAEDSDAAERALLVALVAALTDYDQVCAWNGERFDFPVIEARMLVLRVVAEMRRLLLCDHLVVFAKMNAHASESGDEKQSMSLDAISQSVLGEKKLVALGRRGGPSTWAMWSAGGAQREELVAYCLDDAGKLQRIEAKTGYLDLLWALCAASHCFPATQAVGPIHRMDGYMLRLGLERGVRFPTVAWAADARTTDAPDDEDDEDDERFKRYRGAWVMQPTRRGIVRDVHVADFSRLYPSVIVTWNMSPETVTDHVTVEDASSRPPYLRHLPLKRWPLPPGHTEAAITGVVFRDVGLDVGLLPLAVSRMLEERKKWDDLAATLPYGSPGWLEANRISSACKIAANAWYGGAGSPGSRFYDRRVAESIAQTGVWLIQETIQHGAASGIETVYGDTDSTFCVGATRSQFAAFVARCNAGLYPRLAASRGCTASTIKLAYEKQFERVVFVTAKRYAGRVAHYKGKDADATSRPEIKGLEFKRGDQVRLARGLQAEALDLLMGGGVLPGSTRRPDCAEDPAEFHALAERWRARCAEGQLELTEVVLSKGLSKNLREYVRKTKNGPKRVADLIGERVRVVHSGRVAAEGEVVRVAPTYVAVEGRDRSVLVSRAVPRVSADDVAKMGLAELAALGSGGDDRVLAAVQVYASQSPHLEVARILAHRGEDVSAGTRIEYVVVDGHSSPKRYAPADDWTGEVDRVHLWNDLVWPPTERLLEAAFPGGGWERHRVAVERRRANRAGVETETRVSVSGPKAPPPQLGLDFGPRGVRS